MRLFATVKAMGSGKEHVGGEAPDDHVIVSPEEATLTDFQVAEVRLRHAITVQQSLGIPVSSDLARQLEVATRGRKTFEHLMKTKDPEERQKILAEWNMGYAPPDIFMNGKNFLIDGPETTQ